MAATNYTYDKTGNMTSDTSGRALTYSVFDKPTLISKGTDSVSFAYGPDRNYYKRTDVKAGVTTRTHHIGGVEKVIKSDNSYDIKRYIAGVAIWTHKFSSAGAQTVLDKQYTYKDVLGSTVLITDAIGGIKGQMAFDEWGKRVSYGDWRTDQSATYGALQVAALFTTQGYTGHDMLDAVGLIHMQGRIYDARLGRFVQADPIVQDATDLQAYNRYAYVRNNPLTLTDPSGFSWFSKTWKKVWKAVKPIVGMVVSAVLIYFQQYALAAAFNAAWTKANGGTWGDALIAGVSTYAFAQFAPGGAFHGWGTTAQVLTAGSLGGVMSELQGGKFGSGFLAAGLGAMAGMANIGDETLRFGFTVVAGGTISELTGGKFANGAASAAMGYVAGRIASGIDRMRANGDPSAFKSDDQGDYLVNSDGDKVYSRDSSVLDTRVAANDDPALLNQLRNACIAHGGAACTQAVKVRYGGSPMENVLKDFIDLTTTPTRILNPIARRGDGLLDIGKTVYGYLNGQNGSASATAFGTGYGMAVEKITGSGAVGAAVGKFVEHVTKGAWEAEIPNAPQK